MIRHLVPAREEKQTMGLQISLDAYHQHLTSLNREITPTKWTRITQQRERGSNDEQRFSCRREKEKQTLGVSVSAGRLFHFRALL